MHCERLLLDAPPVLVSSKGTGTVCISFARSLFSMPVLCCLCACNRHPVCTAYNLCCCRCVRALHISTILYSYALKTSVHHALYRHAINCPREVAHLALRSIQQQQSFATMFLHLQASSTGFTALFVTWSSARPQMCAHYLPCPERPSPRQSYDILAKPVSCGRRQLLIHRRHLLGLPVLTLRLSRYHLIFPPASPYRHHNQVLQVVDLVRSRGPLCNP